MAWKCTNPEEDCPRKPVCSVRDSSAPGGFEDLCWPCYLQWQPPKKDVTEQGTWTRKKKRRRKTKEI